jgi:hypothetical protein
MKALIFLILTYLIKPYNAYPSEVTDYVNLVLDCPNYAFVNEVVICNFTIESSAKMSLNIQVDYGNSKYERYYFTRNYFNFAFK